MESYHKSKIQRLKKRKQENKKQISLLLKQGAKEEKDIPIIGPYVVFWENTAEFTWRQTAGNAGAPVGGAPGRTPGAIYAVIGTVPGVQLVHPVQRIYRVPSIVEYNAMMNAVIAMVDNGTQWAMRMPGRPALFKVWIVYPKNQSSVIQDLTDFP